MKTPQEMHKFAKHVFRLLKVNEIIFPIARTNKGNLGLKFTESSNDYEMYLDAVPLSTKNMLEDENNIELRRMIEKYVFEEESPVISSDTITYTAPFVPLKKKGGRPKGSKNKAK